MIFIIPSYGGIIVTVGARRGITTFPNLNFGFFCPLEQRESSRRTNIIVGRILAGYERNHDYWVYRNFHAAPKGKKTKTQVNIEVSLLLISYVRIFRMTIWLSTMGWTQLEGLLTVSGNPSSLGITTASAGGVPNTVTDTSTTYSFTSSSDASRIVGAVNSNLPGNTSLTIMLAAPVGASSAGAVVLNTTNQDLVTDIPIASGNNLNITYQFSATCAAGVISPITRTVTLTLLP